MSFTSLAAQTLCQWMSMTDTTTNNTASTMVIPTSTLLKQHHLSSSSSSFRLLKGTTTKKDEPEQEQLWKEILGDLPEEVFQQMVDVGTMRQRLQQQLGLQWTVEQLSKRVQIQRGQLDLSKAPPLPTFLSNNKEEDNDDNDEEVSAIMTDQRQEELFQWLQWVMIRSHGNYPVQWNSLVLLATVQEEDSTDDILTVQLEDHQEQEQKQEYEYECGRWLPELRAYVSTDGKHFFRIISFL